MRSTKEMRGARVLGGSRGIRKIGKVLCAVFDPQSFNLAGYLVTRPDLLFMIKRDDRFLAFDAFRVIDGRIVGTVDRDSWDDPACRRLGLDWDSALILEGMPVKTSSGEDLGHVDAVNYNERTGVTESLEVTDGVTAKALLGIFTIPREYIIGYAQGYLAVDAKAARVKAEGGLAAKAGEGVAVASKSVSDIGAKAGKAVSNVVDKAAKAAGERAEEASKATGEAIGKAGKAAGSAAGKVGKSAGEAIDKGAYVLGKQLRRSKGMFSAFKEEYKKESARDK